LVRCLLPSNCCVLFNVFTDSLPSNALANHVTIYTYVWKRVSKYKISKYVLENYILWSCDHVSNWYQCPNLCYYVWCYYLLCILLQSRYVSCSGRGGVRFECEIHWYGQDPSLQSRIDIIRSPSAHPKPRWWALRFKMTGMFQLFSEEVGRWLELLV
jgi:hypothetical protein